MLDFFSAIQYALLFGIIFLLYASDVLAVVGPVSAGTVSSDAGWGLINLSFHSRMIIACFTRCLGDGQRLTDPAEMMFLLWYLITPWLITAEMIWNDECSCVCDDTETPAALLYQTNTTSGIKPCLRANTTALDTDPVQTAGQLCFRGTDIINVLHLIEWILCTHKHIYEWVEPPAGLEDRCEPLDDVEVEASLLLCNWKSKCMMGYFKQTDALSPLLIYMCFLSEAQYVSQIRRSVTPQEQKTSVCIVSSIKHAEQRMFL